MFEDFNGFAKLIPKIFILLSKQLSRFKAQMMFGVVGVLSKGIGAKTIKTILLKYQENGN
jgi:hypothetical protein